MREALEGSPLHRRLGEAFHRYIGYLSSPLWVSKYITAMG
jgi:hypothetical protein